MPKRQDLKTILIIGATHGNEPAGYFAIREYINKLNQQEIVPNSTDHLFINTVERDFLVNVINIIESHLDDPEFGVDKLAKKVAMSTPILYKKIK